MTLGEWWSRDQETGQRLKIVSVGYSEGAGLVRALLRVKEIIIDLTFVSEVASIMTPN